MRYLAAGELESEPVKLDGAKVRNDENEDLGKVNGFIVDSDSGRPYYVVVDAGGWFRSKHYLLPVGHARRESESGAIVTDLPKERIKRFPGFDLSRFEKLTEDDMRRINDETCVVCSTTVVSYSADEPYAAAWERPEYRTPSWWRGSGSSKSAERDRNAESRQPDAARH
jgi:hypothetical protein